MYTANLKGCLSKILNLKTLSVQGMMGVTYSEAWSGQIRNKYLGKHCQVFAAHLPGIACALNFY
jgi:hypothetical protein